MAAEGESLLQTAFRKSDVYLVNPWLMVNFPEVGTLRLFQLEELYVCCNLLNVG